jgi:hypothetical protein
MKKEDREKLDEVGCLIYLALVPLCLLFPPVILVVFALRGRKSRARVKRALWDGE